MIKKLTLNSLAFMFSLTTILTLSYTFAYFILLLQYKK